MDRVAVLLANGFARRGIKTELLICAKGGPAEETLLKLAGEDLKLRFFRQTSANRTKDLLLGAASIGKHLQESRPDIVLSAGNNVAMLAALLTWFYCPRYTRLFIKTTNPVVRPALSLVKSLFRRGWYSLIFHICDGVLTLTEAESKNLIEYYPYLQHKLLCVSNPYITELHSPAQKAVQSHEQNRPLQLIAVGRMQQQKRFDILLSAFARVSKQLNVRLLILGEGEDRQALEAQSASLGIAELVEMPGFVSNVNESLDAADLFVLSSDYEGLPAVVLESLARNCPVVATDCFYGAEELLQNINACAVVTRRDPNALARAIVTSLSHKVDTSEIYRNAQKYCLEPAIDNHLDAMCRIIYQGELLAW